MGPEFYTLLQNWYQLELVLFFLNTSMMIQIHNI